MAGSVRTWQTILSSQFHIITELFYHFHFQLGFGLAGVGVGAGAGFDLVPRSGLANPRLTTIAAATMSQSKQVGGPCHGKTGFVPDYQQQCQVKHIIRLIHFTVEHPRMINYF